MTAACPLIELRERTWGGKRDGAGRKASGRSEGVRHRPRPVHKARHPLHATIRLREGLPNCRERVLFEAVREALVAASKAAFRVVHFSVQSNHLHLLVEAHDKNTLSRGMQGLAIRVAKAINRVLLIRGQVFEGRYHAHELKSPREVRSAILYVLQNSRKLGSSSAGIDSRSSGAWFDGWREGVVADPGPPPVAAARTWLVTTGWRRHGLLSIDETPKLLADAPS